MSDTTATAATFAPRDVVEWHNSRDSRIVHTGVVVDAAAAIAHEVGVDPVNGEQQARQYLADGLTPVKVLISAEWESAPVLPVTTVATRQVLPNLFGVVVFVRPDLLVAAVDAAL